MPWCRRAVPGSTCSGWVGPAGELGGHATVLDNGHDHRGHRCERSGELTARSVPMSHHIVAVSAGGSVQPKSQSRNLRGDADLAGGEVVRRGPEEVDTEPDWLRQRLDPQRPEGTGLLDRREGRPELRWECGLPDAHVPRLLGGEERDVVDLDVDMDRRDGD